jgi:hypothetical protein
MYLKLRRVVRTPRSEKIALFDLDERDTAGQPVNFGLLHLHYLEDSLRGTMVLAPAYWTRQQARMPRRAAESNDMLFPGQAQGRREEEEASGAAAEGPLVEFIDMIMREVCTPPGVPGACEVLVVFAPPGGRQFLSNSPRLLAQEEPDEPPDDDAPVRPRSLLGG